jgi:hypothetical protein
VSQLQALIGTLRARLRWRLARHPGIARTLAVALALVAGLGVRGAHESARRAEAAWGRGVEVLVATRPIAPGEPLAAAVEIRRAPRPVVPATAIARVEPDAVARHHLAAGEVVVGSDVATGGALGVAPAGWRGVAIATAPSARPDLLVGDLVGVVAGSSAVTDGVVIAVDEARVVVAVPAEMAAPVAGAALAGDATVVLAAVPGQRKPAATAISTTVPSTTR